MIDLTPLEVRQKKGDFRRSFRGYDVELVNDFLDLAADRMEELVKRNMELSDSAESLGEELEEYRTKERALSEALMAAQKLREDARSHADKEGELLIREARLAAESARQEASRALAREEETLRQVRARRGQLVQSFRRLLERELGELAVIEETLALEKPQVGPGASRPVEGHPVQEGPAEYPAAEAGSAGRQEPTGSGRSSVAGKPRAGVAAEPPRNEKAEARQDEKDVPEEQGEKPAPGEQEEETEVQEDWLKSLVEE